MRHLRVALLLPLAACGGPDSGDLDEDADDAAAIAQLYLGDTACAAGNLDCNSCVNDVRATLDAGFAGAFHWDAKPWRFQWTRNYAPSGAEPEGVYQDEDLLPEHHVQGFVRTNSRRIRFMMTHSDTAKGSISRIEQLADGRKQLATLVRSNDNHPSGGQVLGAFFAFAEGNALRVLDVDGPATDYRVGFPTTDTLGTGASGAGGGLGAARLRDGRTLIVVSTPGGDARATRRTLFYVKSGGLSARSPLTLVGETPYAQPSTWSGDYQRSENLSVITECSTGRIFTLHATGDVNGFDGYFRLSRVDTAADGSARLTTLKAYPVTQNPFNCHLRSSGTAFGTATHRLELYCHQWSTQRLLWESTGEFHFTVAD